MGFGDNVVLKSLGQTAVVAGSADIVDIGVDKTASASIIYGCEKILCVIKVASLTLTGTLNILFDASVNGVDFTSGGALGKVAITAAGNYLFVYAGAPVSNLRISSQFSVATDSAQIQVDFEGTNT